MVTTIGSEDREHVMTNHEKIIDYLDEFGGATKATLCSELGLNPSQAHNALVKLVMAGRVHCVGSSGTRGGVYRLGPAPGWLPKHLPANSIWQHAERIGSAAQKAATPALWGAA